jgi:hypothetical protein
VAKQAASSVEVPTMGWVRLMEVRRVQLERACRMSEGEKGAGCLQHHKSGMIDSDLPFCIPSKIVECSPQNLWWLASKAKT